MARPEDQIEVPQARRQIQKSHSDYGQVLQTPKADPKPFRQVVLDWEAQCEVSQYDNATGDADQDLSRKTVHYPWPWEWEDKPIDLEAGPNPVGVPGDPSLNDDFVHVKDGGGESWEGPSETPHDQNRDKGEDESWLFH